MASWKLLPLTLEEVDLTGIACERAQCSTQRFHTAMNNHYLLANEAFHGVVLHCRAGSGGMSDRNCDLRRTQSNENKE